MDVSLTYFEYLATADEDLVLGGLASPSEWFVTRGRAFDTLAGIRGSVEGLLRRAPSTSP